ncbi:OmpA family protein [Georgenia satyanarayanai]|uniref:OmpA family protein n=1 Tax=Georgenia satyanarayanai TaxID=860221 RepID=UPI00203E4E2A|nr:OmpA family protein [Georgenia satyanarayanai]MCM3659393.1 OmpA family protein [Georgenia satyanarayanai]
MRAHTPDLLLLTVALAVLVAGPAGAVSSPDDPPTPTARQLAQSVHQWDPSGSIRSVESVETDDGVTTITLATDILFASQSDEMPSSAAPRIAELLADVPDGAAVQVNGHTDSLVGPIPNGELSESRARAVADVVAAERPDLTIDVAGLADSEPAVRENPNEPSTYAANRRVEILYGG